MIISMKAGLTKLVEPKGTIYCAPPSRCLRDMFQDKLGTDPANKIFSYVEDLLKAEAEDEEFANTDSHYEMLVPQVWAKGDPYVCKYTGKHYYPDTFEFRFDLYFALRMNAVRFNKKKMIREFHEMLDKGDCREWKHAFKRAVRDAEKTRRMTQKMQLC